MNKDYVEIELDLNKMDEETKDMILIYASTNNLTVNDAINQLLEQGARSLGLE